MREQGRLGRPAVGYVARAGLGRLTARIAVDDWLLAGSRKAAGESGIRGRWARQQIIASWLGP